MAVGCASCPRRWPKNDCPYCEPLYQQLRTTFREERGDPTDGHNWPGPSTKLISICLRINGPLYHTSALVMKLGKCYSCGYVPEYYNKNIDN